MHRSDVTRWESIMSAQQMYKEVDYHAHQPSMLKTNATLQADRCASCMVLTDIKFDAHVTMHSDTFLIIKPTKCTNFSKFIFGMKLYMFRTVRLSIIRSFPLYTQQMYVSYRFADSLWAGSGWNSVPSWSCPKHVEFHSKNKFWEISASSWFYYKKDIKSFTQYHI
jgi:hypothetical protein